VWRCVCRVPGLPLRLTRHFGLAGLSLCIFEDEFFKMNLNEREERIMRLPTLAIFATMVFILPALDSAGAETVLSSQEASRALKFEKLDVNGSKISGVIANKTPHTIKDVQLMVQYHWLWQNERNPGEDSPGRTIMIPLNEQLEPGESHSFSYTPQFSLPSRDDGYFMPEVDVAGFTTVVQQQASAR
jgi:hypothetical protein